MQKRKQPGTLIQPAVMFSGAVPVLRLSRPRSSKTPNPKTVHEEVSAVHRSDMLVILILQAVDLADANLFADCVRIFVICDLRLCACLQIRVYNFVCSCVLLDLFVQVLVYACVCALARVGCAICVFDT